MKLRHHTTLIAAVLFFIGCENKGQDQAGAGTAPSLPAKAPVKANDCTVSSIPNVRYINPSSEVSPRPISLAGGFPSSLFDTNNMLWPYSPGLGVSDSFGLAAELKALVTNSFILMGKPATFGQILDSAYSVWSNEGKREALLNVVTSNNGNTGRVLTGLITEFLNDGFFQSRQRKWVELGANTLEVSNDGFYSRIINSPNAAGNSRTIRVFEFATVLFLGHPCVTNLDYTGAIALWLAVERDPTLLPQWTRPEYRYTSQSQVMPSSCFRSTDGRNAFAAFDAYSTAPGKYKKMTTFLFERIDSNGHRVSDYYESRGYFAGRDTLIPLCDGNGRFIALLAITQFATFDGNIPGPQTVREALGVMRQSAEDLCRQLWQSGQSINSLLRPEPK